MNTKSIEFENDYKSEDKLDSIMYSYFFNDPEESNSMHNKLYFIADKCLHYLENEDTIRTILFDKPELIKTYRRVIFNDNRGEHLYVEDVCVDFILDHEPNKSQVNPQVVVGIQVLKRISEADIISFAQIFEILINNAAQKEDCGWPYLPVVMGAIRESFSSYRSRSFEINNVRK